MKREHNGKTSDGNYNKNMKRKWRGKVVKGNIISRERNYSKQVVRVERRWREKVVGEKIIKK